MTAYTVNLVLQTACAVGLLVGMVAVMKTTPVCTGFGARGPRWPWLVIWISFLPGAAGLVVMLVSR
ncbi:hypothetical protein [Amycolatopsis sp. NPDC051903]|uniref:hypothetical protein n=1 Tax=Amycolatopsis sp. NPDC051903 TaxID=3363936 RepID=UPI0037AB6076